jgi:peptidoglycan/xylan/chitin deacetylase (PgdA/CDA1 family)
MTGRLRTWTILAAPAVLTFLWQGAGVQGQQRGRGSQPPPPQSAWTEDQLRQAMAIGRVGRRLTPKVWPNGARVAVSIGYDVDNMGIGRDGGPLPAAASSGEYGAVDGLPRILALLDRQQLPATFFMPVSSAILNPEMIGMIQKSGRHEIALHGYVHENQNTVNNADEELKLLNQELDYFQRVLGKRPVGSRAPAWNFSVNSIEAIKKAGLLYDSSMMGLDEAYEIDAHGKPTGIVELPVEWILDDAPYFGANGALPIPELIFKTYRDEFDVAYKEGTLVILTFHPTERSRIADVDCSITSAKPAWFGTAGRSRARQAAGGRTHWGLASA